MSKEIEVWAKKYAPLESYLVAKKQAFLNIAEGWLLETDYNDWYFNNLSYELQEFTFPSYVHWVKAQYGLYHQYVGDEGDG